MASGSARTFLNDDRAAIGPMYALALFGLVAMGTVGFDYGRLMALNSELQSAADQAALAAATQLDGRDDAITRARAAANTYFAKATVGGTAPTYANNTYIAQDESGANAVTIPDANIVFYTGYASDAPTGSVLSTSAADQRSAKIVQVTVSNRRITKPLTPITNILLTANAQASAMARVDGAVCNVPPLMICAPDNTPAFPEGYEGVGVLMEPGGQTGAWAPGAFGYLDLVNGPGSNGADALRDLLGSATLQNQCRSTSATVDAATGNKTSATDALNTAFDIYSNNQYACQGDGDFCPGQNTRKDQVRTEAYEYKNKRQSEIPAATAMGCNRALAKTTGNPNPSVSDWGFVPSMAAAHAQGFPRDDCHYANNCNGLTGQKYGTGVWTTGKNAYFAAVHGLAPGSIPASLTTRYKTYVWENDAGNTSRVAAVKLAGSTTAWVGTGCGGGADPKCDWAWTNYCAYPKPVSTTAIAPGKDRRILTVAAVDCSAGSNTGTNHSFYLKRWVDVFLVEPSLNRTAAQLGVTQGTSQSQIYGEIIGPAKKADGTSGFQYYGRNKAVLIR